MEFNFVFVGINDDQFFFYKKMSSFLLLILEATGTDGWMVEGAGIIL